MGDNAVVQTSWPNHPHQDFQPALEAWEDSRLAQNYDESLNFEAIRADSELQTVVDQPHGEHAKGVPIRMKAPGAFLWDKVLGRSSTHFWSRGFKMVRRFY